MVVKELKKEILKLSQDELSQFRHWFQDFDAKQWDDQIKNDALNGRLDSLAD